MFLDSQVLTAKAVFPFRASTHRQTDTNENPTHAAALAGVGNKRGQKIQAYAQYNYQKAQVPPTLARITPFTE